MSPHAVWLNVLLRTIQANLTGNNFSKQIPFTNYSAAIHLLQNNWTSDKPAYIHFKDIREL